MRAIRKTKPADSQCELVQYGYGQVEANRLTGITFGNIEAQVPAFEDAAAKTPIEVLENGRFLCVVADTTGKTGPMGRIAVTPGAAKDATPYLVYSEKKIYDEREGYSDYVDRAADKVDGLCYPRLIGLTPDSCVFTTNTVFNITPEEGEIKSDDLTVGDKLYINNEGFLSTEEGTNKTYMFIVDQITTMPDGQPAVKVHCARYVASN